MSTPHTVAFHTLGCKLNFSETSSIRRKFEDYGFSTVDFSDVADIYVLNTCSVTEFADRKCRAEVRKVLRQSPEAKVVVIGCYAQLKPQEIADIEGVDLVLGAAEKFNILKYIDLLSGASDKGMVQAGKVEEANTFVGAFSYGDRTRSFLKVQDGCDYKCSFCTIPQARGGSRSDTISNAILNVEKIGALGVKEIVLTGVNLGDFGKGTEVIEGLRPKNEELFIDLIKALDPLESVSRYRISSIEPNLLTDEIIEFVAGSKHFMPHFHIPLQSGSDKTLKMMRRRYQSKLYAEKVQKIKSIMPHACIGVDVIVGFPGETDGDFNDTYQFIESLDVSYLHVFTYSKRANTPAADIKDEVPIKIKRERNEALRALSNKKKKKFYTQHLRTQREVLFEKSKKKGMMTGFTDNYIKIVMPYDPAKINTISNVYLNNTADQDTVWSLDLTIAEASSQ
jgi:threonylcarbamoyladenosine tRNA methylthiotransferase MtaB